MATRKPTAASAKKASAKKPSAIIASVNETLEGLRKAGILPKAKARKPRGARGRGDAEAKTATPGKTSSPKKTPRKGNVANTGAHPDATAPTPTLKPLYMWAGGKRRLIPKYAAHLPAVADIPHFVEPFLGGGALFAHLVAQRPDLPATLGDTNREIIGLLTVIRDRPDALLAAIKPYEKKWAGLNLAGRKAYYYQLRKNYWKATLDDAGYALLYFLMKTGFNGIWQTCQDSLGRFGTPVGLANQKGAVIDSALVRDWSRVLQHTTLAAQSFEHTDVPMGAFVFCDPPYRDSFTHYSTGFNDTDQLKLIAWCRKTAQDKQALVWLANREAGDGFFEQHVHDAQRIKIPVVYTAGRRKKTEDGFEAKPATELLMIWDGRRA